MARSRSVSFASSGFEGSELLQVLPTGLSNRLAAVPVDLDEDGAVIVAVLDPRDTHVPDVVKLVRAPDSILREAVLNYATTVQSIVRPPGVGRERRRAMAYTTAWGITV